MVAELSHAFFFIPKNPLAFNNLSTPTNLINSYIGSWAFVGDQKSSGGRFAYVNASAQAVSITGTAGLVVGAGNDLVVTGSGIVTISAPILNQPSNNSHLTYAGGGSLTLQTSASAYTRQTTLTSGNNIALTIGGDKAVWTGAASSNWTISAVPSPFNWKTQTGAADTDFLVGDDVIFDDTATGSTSVNITDAAVSPNTTTFDNSTKSYTISGGGIATGTLTKIGTNTVSLTNTNTYTGATTIGVGKGLIVTADGALGAAGIGNETTVTGAGTGNGALRRHQLLHSGKNHRLRGRPHDWHAHRICRKPTWFHPVGQWQQRLCRCHRTER
jgi:autotransporter-associated beta strand protein